MSLVITGKTAIVTGAAKGIGLAVARHFLAKGANVVCLDSDEARLEAELGAQSNLRIFGGDMCHKLTLSNLLSATNEAFGHIDILVNAHRKWLPSDPLDHNNDAVEALWQSNVLPSLRLSQMVARRMIEHGETLEQREKGAPVGSIINLSSLAAQRLQPGLLGYAMASAAIEQMTRALAVELAPNGIRVNAIAFGSLMSDSLQAALKEKPEWRGALLDATPQGRIATPDELVEAVQYLASDASRFMTGQVLTLDGGRGLLDSARVPAF